ncbi:hypothetical protein Tco_0284258 [Tanacetum coccineum]
MKLNPKKCTFGATEGMFLGYLLEPDGIKPCPGKLAGLNRFLSKLADKSLPLFKTLKKCTKKGDFRWTTEAEEAFSTSHASRTPTKGGVDYVFIRDAWGN